MRDDPDSIKYEEYIVWRRNPELYAYLRVGVMSCAHRVRFPLKKFDPSKCTDGGPGAHIVAYAVLNPNAPSNYFRDFERRYWWVKEYDRFVGGKRPVKRDGSVDNGCYMDTLDAPCEAVDVSCIIAGFPSQYYDPDEECFCQ